MRYAMNGHDIKRNNLNLILECFRKSKLLSRVDLARMTDLTKPTISMLIAELIEKGIVIECGEVETQGKFGRRPRMLTMNRLFRFVIGIDLSHESMLRGVVCDLSGHVHAQRERPYNEDFECICANIVDIVGELCRYLGGASNVIGVGIAVAGIVDTDKNEVVKSVKFDIAYKNMADRLSKRLNMRVILENESNAAALSESLFGVMDQASHLMYASVEKGVGLGIVINNSLYYGTSFSSGEIGHIMAVPEGELCSCGKRGCLEAESSHPALIHKAARALSRPVESFAEVATLYQQGNETVTEIVLYSGCLLGQVLAYVYNILNISRIVVGGAECFGLPYLREVRRAFAQYALCGEGRVSIEFATVGDNAIAIGATVAVAALLLDVQPEARGAD